MPQLTSHDSRAVSPVVAVILLVAVTVTLSAVIGGFALELGQSTTSSTSQQDVGVKLDQSDGNVTATVITGDADEVKLLVNGSSVDSVSNPSAGDTLSATVSEDDSVTIVQVTDGSRSVVSSTTVESSGTTQAVSAPTDGLIHYWAFNDTSNSTAIDEAGSWDADLKSGTSYTSTFSGTGVDLDGVDDWVSTRQTTVPTAGTVSYYVNPDNTSDTDNQLVGIGGTGEQLRTMMDTGNQTVALQLQNGSYSEVIYTDDALKNDTWTHIVVTWNYTTGQRSIYYDGQLQGRATFDQSPPSDKDGWRIGRQTRDASADRFFDGQFDDWRMYDHDLNQSEVGDLYNATK